MKIQDDITYCDHCFFFKQRLTDVVKESGKDCVPIKCPVCKEEAQSTGRELKDLIPALCGLLEDIMYGGVYCPRCEIGGIDYKLSSKADPHTGKLLCKDCVEDLLATGKISISQVEKIPESKND